MLSESFEIGVDGGLLRGSVVGRGDAVLLLHGGPGLPWTYMQALVDEICDGYQVAVYQQRGLPPSTAGAPFDVPTQVADVVAVLDGLGWNRAVVIGHSWGGHLLLHLLAAHPERVAAAMVIDPLGGVGDGGEAQFEAELNRRTPPESVVRAQELDQQAMDGQGTEADAVESLRLYCRRTSPTRQRRRRSPTCSFRWRRTRRRSSRCIPSCPAWPGGSSAWRCPPCSFMAPAARCRSRHRPTPPRPSAPPLRSRCSTASATSPGSTVPE